MVLSDLKWVRGSFQVATWPSERPQYIAGAWHGDLTSPLTQLQAVLPSFPPCRRTQNPRGQLDLSWKSSRNLS